MSLRSVWQADITLDNVRVPAGNRLPGARSFKDTSLVLATTRSTCAGPRSATPSPPTTPPSRYATRASSATAGELPDLQRLVTMLADLTAMQLYCLQIGRLAEAGRLTPTVAGLAKMHNTRKARAIAAEARTCSAATGSCSTTR